MSKIQIRFQDLQLNINEPLVFLLYYVFAGPGPERTCGALLLRYLAVGWLHNPPEGPDPIIPADGPSATDGWMQVPGLMLTGALQTHDSDG